MSKTKKAVFIIIYFFLCNLLYAQETFNEAKVALIEKYNINPYVTYELDSIDLKSVYIPFVGINESYFVDYFGKRKSEQNFDDIKLVKNYPFFWGKKNDKYFLYRFPEKQILNRGFEWPWAFGSADFKDTYCISPNGSGSKKIIFTETNNGNSSRVTLARSISSHANFSEEFNVNNQDIFPLILLEEDSLKTVIAINGDKIFDCINCEITNIYNQKRFITVKENTKNYKIYDIVNRSFLEGEYNQISRSSRPHNMFYAFEEYPKQMVTFFNNEGIKTFKTDYVSINGVKDNLYYITKNDEYQMVNIATGEIIASSNSPIKNKLVNDRLYILDEKNNYYYDSENTKLEEITNSVTEETRTVRVPINKAPQIRSRFFVDHQGLKFYLGLDNGKSGWVRSDSSWIVEPKFNSINKFGNEGLYVASQINNNDELEYALMKFPETIIYPFEKRKLSVHQLFGFDLSYLVIEDFNSIIGINSSFEVVYDPNEIFISPNGFKRKDLDDSVVKNTKNNEIIFPFLVLGNYSTGFIFDCKGNFKYQIDENVINVTSHFGFDDISKYYFRPILPLGEIINYDSQKTVVLFRLEDGYVYRENK